MKKYRVAPKISGRTIWWAIEQRKLLFFWAQVRAGQWFESRQDAIEVAERLQTKPFYV